MKTLTRAEIEAIETENYIEAAIKADMLKYNLDHIVTRFPPEPNGFLTIGHLKAIAIDFKAAEKFGGYTNLRFDDTNPTGESVEYEEAIKRDISWLGLKWQNVFYASDYFEKMYDCAVVLIKKGLAYVCSLNEDEIRATRGTLTEPGVNCADRERSIEENLDLFSRMRNGEFKEGEYTLRAKIDMASPNINMRDPIIYRILYKEHYRQGNKWCIYPMYDFAHPLEDAFENVTHSLCSLEFMDHRPLYEWVLNNCDLPNHPLPRQIEFARMNLENIVLSKRHFKKLMAIGKLEGWEDPRLPLIGAMRARGYTPTALLDFIDRVGASKSEGAISTDVLDFCQREELNKTAQRVMVVLNPLKVVITNYTGSEQLEIENNPNEEPKTTHKVTFSNEIYIDKNDFMEDAPTNFFRLKKDGYVRLKGAYIIKCDNVVKDKDGNIDYLECSYIPESKSGGDTSGIKVKGTIHWVDAKDNVDITVRKIGSLVKEGMSFTGDWESVFNKDSLITVNAKASTCIEEMAKSHKHFQFLREGYYYLFEEKDNKLVFNLTVNLKDTKKAK